MDKKTKEKFSGIGREKSYPTQMESVSLRESYRGRAG